MKALSTVFRITRYVAKFCLFFLSSGWSRNEHLTGTVPWEFIDTLWLFFAQTKDAPRHHEQRLLWKSRTLGRGTGRGYRWNMRSRPRIHLNDTDRPGHAIGPHTFEGGSRDCFPFLQSIVHRHNVLLQHYFPACRHWNHFKKQPPIPTEFDPTPWRIVHSSPETKGCVIRMAISVKRKLLFASVILIFMSKNSATWRRLNMRASKRLWWNVFSKVWFKVDGELEVSSSF